MKKPPAPGQQTSRSRSETSQLIPVLKPLLPRADRLLPYLRRIDAARCYTNWGPLTAELEQRLCQHFHLPERSVVSASSGTAALVGAILARTGRAKADRPLAVVPAFTFVATAIAVEQCGYEPYLADINAESWQLDVKSLTHHALLNRIGLVVPVAAFGRPVPQDPWIQFQRGTDIPVVIDAAAAFEAVSAHPRRFLGRIPTTMSFHATKSFGTGEGGCVVTTDRRLSTRVAQALNFSFYESRSSRFASTNGKMSEYHAAVGLAELDGWPRKHLALRAVADRYRHQLRSVGLADALIVAPDIATCYVLFQCSDAAEVKRVQHSLTQSQIDFRHWYGNGLRGHPHFSGASHDVLEVTERIAPLVIGLPVAIDLPNSAIERVVAALKRAVRPS